MGAAELAPATYTLGQCMELALQANRGRAVSAAAQKIAEAQLQQALSGRWPEASLDLTALRQAQNPNFVFPSSSFSLGAAAGPLAEAVAATQLAKAGITPNGPGGLAAYNAALASATQTALAQMPAISVPGQNIELFDRDTLSTSLNLDYPLYTGGKVGALIRQGRAGVDAAKAASRATDLQIVEDIHRYYYGCGLSRSLLAIGQQALDSCQMVLELTDQLYQTGSGRVKKTDYLRTQVLVASLKSLVAQLRANQAMAGTALANAMGLPWSASAAPADPEVPVLDYGGDLAELVAKAQTLNPQALQIGYGLAAAEAGVEEARSGHLPVVVLFGSVDRVDNSYHEGLMSDSNRHSWTLGLKVKVPIFNGFRVHGQVLEARARTEQLGFQQQLLNEGLGVEVKNACLQLASAIEQTQDTGAALVAAKASRELHQTAYAQELVETKDVVEALLTELFIAGQHQQARYEAQVHQAELDHLIGSSLAEH
jgi:outer membrane protein TolC